LIAVVISSITDVIGPFLRNSSINSARHPAMFDGSRLHATYVLATECDRSACPAAFQGERSQ
jgi:hypothetical protein